MDGWVVTKNTRAEKFRNTVSWKIVRTSLSHENVSGTPTEISFIRLSFKHEAFMKSFEKPTASGIRCQLLQHTQNHDGSGPLHRDPPLLLALAAAACCPAPILFGTMRPLYLSVLLISLCVANGSTTSEDRTALPAATPDALEVSEAVIVDRRELFYRVDDELLKLWNADDDDNDDHEDDDGMLLYVPRLARGVDRPRRLERHVGRTLRYASRYNSHHVLCVS
jgi:hypothetical protein